MQVCQQPLWVGSAPKEEALPKEMHRRLSLQADRRGLTGERKNAYMYGTMNKIDGNTVKRRLKRKKLVDPNASRGD